MPSLKISMLSLVLFVTTACVSTPENVEAVKGFELERYLGRWYEIARLDHSFERGLDRVTAEYSMREDGGVKVINRGYSSSEGKWEEAEGKAYFVEDENTGFLKVSFFGPFYGAYIVFNLDKTDYSYAFVSGPDTSYLWLLARSPQVPQAVIDAFVTESNRLGFDTSKLIFVNHAVVEHDENGPSL